MLKSCLLASCLLIASCAAITIEEAVNVEKLPAGSTTYDQRQTGKYNVHVNIKDVQFFSLSDALGNVGGDYGEEYGDYGALEGIGEGDADYDTAALTVNPVFAFLGSRPTTAKPTTTSTTEKVQSDANVSSASLPISAPPQRPTTAPASDQSTTTLAPKESPVLVVKPLAVNDTVDYEEIPVEVQYYRTNHQKLPANGRRDPSHRYFKRPAVQIIDGHGRASNVKIIESDHPVVKICGRGEFRDNMGRCRVRARRGAAGGPGM